MRFVTIRAHGPLSVVMAGNTGEAAPASAALGLVELLTAKTARDLALDMQIKGPPGQVKK